MEPAGKRVMVVGLGASGRAAAHFLASRGAHLVLTDLRADIERDGLPEGELRLGGDDPDWLSGVDVVVTSPGVPRDARLLREARRRAIPVRSEIELAACFVRAPIVAVTGTNGKSTVTVLAADMLKASGLKVFAGGNLGTPLIEAASGCYDVAVAEISSFQLEWIDTFRPHVGVHLNLSADHLDRYRDLEDYAAAKARLFANQDADDFAVLCRDDPEVWKLAERVRSRVVSFGLSRPDSTPAVWCDGGKIGFAIDGVRGAIDAGGFGLRGTHNLSNAMAAAAAALVAGAEAPAIERALAGFRGLPHRIEIVRDVEGVTYVDDSKGTNVGATVEAIRSFDAPLVLIAGGRDKGGDYGPLCAAARGRVRCAILIGEARERMKQALAGACEVVVVETLTEAVERARRLARRGDVVLLSPACSSFDQFRDYAERGQVFQELVRSL
jgi:UDP-N-acetylmuramoylalanine--D-glutamate ligase